MSSYAVTRRFDESISQSIRTWYCLLLLRKSDKIHPHESLCQENRLYSFRIFPLFSQMCLRQRKHKDCKPHFACVIVVTEFIIKQFNGGFWPGSHSVATSVTDLHQGSDYTLQTWKTSMRAVTLSRKYYKVLASSHMHRQLQSSNLRWPLFNILYAPWTP